MKQTTLTSKSIHPDDMALFRHHIEMFIKRVESLETLSKTISEDFALPKERWFARAAAVVMHSDHHNDDKGYIFLYMLHPQYMLNVSGGSFKYGNKEDLLEFMRADNIVDLLLERAQELDENLRDYDNED